MYKFRFAPSPNGYLHLGHAYSALLNAQLAIEAKGELLLRIEDSDQTRARLEFEQAIYEDLAWLGVKYNPHVRRQSEHFGFYKQTLERLFKEGLLYKSFETRSELKLLDVPKDPDGAVRFPIQILSPQEIARREARNDAFSLRLNSQKLLHLRPHAEPWGDVILARKDTPASYHLCVVLDDALQDITHVVRGKDLEPAKELHILLQKTLQLPTPHYHHHPLVCDEGGGKLSKSKGAKPLRESGLTPIEIFAEYKAKKWL